VSEGEDAQVTACRIVTPLWEVRAFQFTGWQAIQQTLDNGHTKAVMYYTWCVVVVWPGECGLGRLFEAARQLCCDPAPGAHRRPHPPAPPAAPASAG
jgi:hypothetical protein